MKRFIVAVVVFSVVFAAGVSHAQEKDQPVIPEKVLKSFENIIGVWNLEGKIGDVPFKGRDTIKWSPGKHCVIWNGTRKIGDAQTIHLTSLLYWDGFSGDGFISSIAYSFGGTDTVRFKVESENVVAGQLTGVTFGKKSKGQIRFEKKNPNQFTLSYTERVLQGEAQDDVNYVYSRAKISGKAKTEERGKLKGIVSQEGFAWMAGKWKSMTDDGVEATVTYRWAAEGHMIMSNFKIGDHVWQGTIFYDVNDQQVKQIVIDNKGASTKAIWEAEDGKAIMKSKVIELNGKTMDMALVHSKIDRKTMKIAMYGFENGQLSSSPWTEMEFKRQPRF